jgi:hypothetical protein
MLIASSAILSRLARHSSLPPREDVFTLSLLYQKPDDIRDLWNVPDMDIN